MRSEAQATSILSIDRVFEIVADEYGIITSQGLGTDSALDLLAKLLQEHEKGIDVFSRYTHEIRAMIH